MWARRPTLINYYAFFSSSISFLRSLIAWTKIGISFPGEASNLSGLFFKTNCKWSSTPCFCWTSSSSCAINPTSLMSFFLPSLVSHTNLTGLKSLMKSRPMFASSTSFLSLASDREVIDVTLHLKVAIALKFCLVFLIY